MLPTQMNGTAPLGTDSVDTPIASGSQREILEIRHVPGSGAQGKSVYSYEHVFIVECYNPSTI